MRDLRDSDEFWMRRALELARQGKGSVEPNPMVGCVVVRDGEEIGAGYHQRFGGPHAEVHALEKLEPGAVHAATVYVTLEPCSHFGKTPPCADLLLKYKPARIVVAMDDPYPEVSGRGIARLRDAGIHVEVGTLETEARVLNAPYIKLLDTKLPWVIAKWAMTLDGMLATHSGDSKWITSEASRAFVHRMRSEVDAILVGSETVLLDDPTLTARIPAEEVLRRTPLRVVMDRRFRIPIGCKLAQTASQAGVLVVADQASLDSNPQKVDQIQRMGCEILGIPPGLHHESIEFTLRSLGAKRLTNLLVEGGSQILGSLFDRQLVDQVDCFIAPKILGAHDARRPVCGKSKDWMNQAYRLDRSTWREFDGDIHYRGFVRRS